MREQGLIPAQRVPVMPQPAPAGRLPFDAGTRLLVVSPHLDDAVLGCGELLAGCGGAVVVTVFAGRPVLGSPPTEWDRASGFGPGDDVVGMRREEDRLALRALRATPVWLEHLDAQYGQPSRTDVIAADLAAEICRSHAAAVLVPLGLFHDDHRQAGDAAVSLMHGRLPVEWYAYEEALYRVLRGEVQARLSELRARGVEATPLSGCLAGDRLLPRKHEAVACYRSQLRALDSPSRPGHRDAMAPERYWWLTTG